MRNAIGAMCLSILLTLSGCARESGPEAQDAQDWPAFVQRFVVDWFEAHPMMGFAAGRKEYAGRFPDWSAAGLAAEVSRLKSVATEARAFDAQALTEAQRFEREYLLAVVDRNLFWLERAEWPRRNPTFYFDWNLDFLSPDPYLTKPYAPIEVRLRDFTGWLSNVPAATAQIQANLRTPMPRTWIDQGVASFGGMVPFLRDDAPEVFAEVKDEALQKAYADASARAIAAFKTLADWLQAQRANPDRGLCDRRRTLRRHVEGNGGPRRPAGRLLEAGQADLARNLAALDEACKEFAPGRDRKGCMEKMNANRPVGGAVEGARKQLDVLRAFVVEHKIASIPSDDPIRGGPGAAVPGGEFRLHQHPRAVRKGPAVGLLHRAAGPVVVARRSRTRTSRARPTSCSPRCTKSGRGTSSIPARQPVASHMFGRLFVGYAFAEGWAHYAEEMMWEAGRRRAAVATRSTSASCRTRCCATCRYPVARSACTRGA